MRFFFLLAVALLVASVNSQVFSGPDPNCDPDSPEALCCEGEQTETAETGTPPIGQTKIGPGLGCHLVGAPEANHQREREQCPVRQHRRKRIRADEIAAGGSCSSDAGSNVNQAIATTYGTETGIGTDETGNNVNAVDTGSAPGADTTVFDPGTDTAFPETANAIDGSQTNDYVANSAVIGQE